MRFFALVSLLCAACLAYSQDQLGIVNSNYAGTDVLGFSPARAVYQWQYADIKLAGFGANVWNNHVYLSGNQRSVFGEVRNSIRAGDSELNVSQTISDRSKKGSVFAGIEAPGFLVGLGRNAVGFQVRTKVQTSISGVSPALADIAWNGLGYAPQQDIRHREKNLRISWNAYTEVAGTFARQLHAGGNSLFSAGATLKYLIGHAAGGFLLNSLEYELHDTTALTVYNAQGEFGYAEPAITAGKGIGFDLGLHYQRTIDDASGYVPHKVPYGCEPMKYRYRVSLSVLDVGGINYDRAMSGSFSSSSAFFADYNNITASDPEEVDSLLNASVLNLEETTAFRMGLPTALAADVDVRLAERFYLAFNAVQPIGGLSHLRIRRNAFIGVVPRFETERIGLAAPIVWREYQRPVVGLMLRLNSIIIGSDDIIPWVSRSSKVYSADIYAKVKITLFRKSACKDRSPKAKSDVALTDEEAMPCVLPE